MGENQGMREKELERCDNGGVLEEYLGGGVVVTGSGDSGADSWG